MIFNMFNSCGGARKTEAVLASVFTVEMPRAAARNIETKAAFLLSRVTRRYRTRHPELQGASKQSTRDTALSKIRNTHKGIICGGVWPTLVDRQRMLQIAAGHKQLKALGIIPTYQRACIA